MSIRGTNAKIREKTFIRRLLNCFYCIHRSLFRIFEVVLCQLEIRLQRYRRKGLFDGFEIRFTIFSVLFL